MSLNIVPHFVAYNRVLDDIRDRLKLKNDSALGRALHIAAPAISKIRHGTGSLTPMYVLRVMEILDLSLAEAREFLGEEIYLDLIWSSKTNGDKERFSGYNTNRLWKTQTEVVQTLLTLIRQYRYVILKAGQRSGTSTIQARLAHVLNAKNVYLFSQYPEAENLFPTKCTVHHNVMPSKDEGHALVVIDDAFMRAGAFEIFHAVRRLNVQVLVTGSNGPEYDHEWAVSTIALTYNTWDINPLVTRERLQSAYDLDPEKAARDYEAF